MTLTRDKVLAVLAGHIGEVNGLRAQDLVREAMGETSPRLERELRHIIEELRKNGHHLCGHPSSGYYIARTPEELDRTCRFLYSRAMSSLTQISRMKNLALPDLEGQLRLRT